MITWGVVRDKEKTVIAVMLDDTLETVITDIDEKAVPAALTYGTPDVVRWHGKPWRKLWRQFRSLSFKEMFSTELPDNWLSKHELDVENYHIIIGDIGTPYSSAIQLETVDAHKCAALGASRYANGESNVILVSEVIHGMECMSAWTYDGSDLRKVGSINLPNSLSTFVFAMMKRVGLSHIKHREVFLRMAETGNTKRLTDSIMSDFWTRDYEDGFKLNSNHNLRQGCDWWRPNLYTVQDYADIAASTILIYEHITDNLLRGLKVHGSHVIVTGNMTWIPIKPICHKHFDTVTVDFNPLASSAIGAARY